ncbi:MAG TPA: hypothetical protein PKY05_03305 [Fibrobacteria bacterium]|nr:hypothetical protein [Fibrobacteria bacterium]
MSEYITKVTLDFDGTVIDDFKSFEENEIDLGKVVELAKKTGYAQVTPRYGFKLEYVPPKIGSFDFSPMLTKDAVVTVFYDGGTKATFRGVRLLKKGGSKADGKEEIQNLYEFTASDRSPAL